MPKFQENMQLRKYLVWLFSRRMVELLLGKFIFKRTKWAALAMRIYNRNTQPLVLGPMMGFRTG